MEASPILWERHASELDGLADLVRLAALHPTHRQLQNYCVGANLARMTIDLMFNAIADHLPDLKPIGEPERLRSSMINGIKHWQVDYTGGRPASG